MTTASFPAYSIKGKQVEYKTFHFQIKSFNEDDGTVTGYLSTFGNVDLQKDRVLSGSFKKTLTEAYSRKQNGRKYLFAMLWMHNPDQPIGGYTEATEDKDGLLVTAQLDISTNAAGIPNNPIATMVFSGYKSGYIDEMSMGYIAIQKEYVDGVRNLKECALLEGSAITMLFAANPEALVPASGVKAMFAKTASGKTTWPLADRDTKWDGGQATKDIEEWADGDWSKVAQCFFWVAKSPPEKMDDCKLPFVAKDGDEMKAIPQGIISCAGVLQGAMGGADLGGDEEAVKKKVAAYYKKMDMTPPWEDDGKRRAMNGQQRKDFNEVHQAGKAADALEDWCDLLNDLTQTMFQIFGMSDTNESDMKDCLDQFGQALMGEWLPEAIEADLGQYLNDRGYCSPSTSAYVPYSMQTGSDYGYMSRSGRPGHKSGRTISAATQDTLEQHQEGMKASLKAVADHVKSMQQKVSDLTQLWQEEGQGTPYENDKDDGKSRLTRREPPRTLTREQQPPKSTVKDDMTIDELASIL